MKHDPIVEEIRRVRGKILENCGGDLEELMDHLKHAESEDHSRIVSFEAFRAQYPQRQHTHRLTKRCSGRASNGAISSGRSQPTES